MQCNIFFYIGFDVLKTTDVFELFKSLEMIVDIAIQCRQSREQFRFEKCSDVLVSEKNVCVFFEVFV